MVPTMLVSRCATSPCKPINAAIRRRYISSGALGGGYCKLNLAYFAARHWTKHADDPTAVSSSQQSERRRRRRIQDELDEDELPYADMFHRQISPDANKWLRLHPSPSVLLARVFFSSDAFAPERTILSLAPNSGPSQSLSDSSFNIGETHLLWTVAVKSPLEMILTWELESLGRLKGATQLAFDPAMRRVYQGNALDRVPQWAMPLIPLHERYAEYLLQGLVSEIEKHAALKSGAT